MDGNALMIIYKFKHKYKIYKTTIILSERVNSGWLQYKFSIQFYNLCDIYIDFYKYEIIIKTERGTEK
jgi:hypothetical protein